jgi:hypothetical protein
MTTITFVNVSHPGELQKRNVQTSIRRHVMRDIGRSRRKKPRHKIIPLEVRVAENERQNEKIGERNLESHHQLNENFVYGLYRSPRGSGILGIELDEDALQIVQFSKLSPIDEPTSYQSKNPPFKRYELISLNRL